MIKYISYGTILAHQEWLHDGEYEHMRFFSQNGIQSCLNDSQESIYDAAKEFVFKRLNQILERSMSIESKHALFFLLGVAWDYDDEILNKLLPIFYTAPATQIVKDFLLSLNSLFHGKDTGSTFIKSITDLRLMTSSQTIEQIRKDFGRALQEDVKAWAEENAPDGFYQGKNLLLREKYAAELAPECSENILVMMSNMPA